MAKSFSNRYIFLYSAALAAGAALVISLVSVSLKPLQQKNQEAEQKQMVLKAIGIEASRDDAAALYDKHVEEADGHYTFAGGVILPLRGTGLWGPIWGYLAVDSSGTVVGAVFDHKGETPGLGGEIASDKFARRFIGKRMDNEPIRLKKNADPSNPHEVDAISGGTMTSNGVSAMLEKAYNAYSHPASVPTIDIGHPDSTALTTLNEKETAK